MKRQNVFNLRPEWLAYLLDKTKETRSIFAPHPGAAKPLSSEDLESLRKEGVIDQEENLALPAREALVVLARAKAVARVRISGGEGYLENTVYLGEGPEPWAVLANQSSGLILRYPVTPKEVLREARELMGESIFSTIAWEETLSLPQAVVLAAVVDSARQEMLKALAQDRVETYPLLSRDEVLKWASEPGSNAQWLTVVVKGIIPSEPERAALEEGLSSLLEKGLLKSEGERVSPGPDASFLASRLLLIDKLFSLRAIYQTRQGPRQLGFVAVQGGVNNVLMLECDGSSVQFTGAAPAEILEAAEVAISSLLTMAETPPEIPVKVSEGEKPTCPSCQTEVLSEAKFCPFCGTPLKPKVPEKKENVCPQCQTPVLPQAKFCPSCGEKLFQ